MCWERNRLAPGFTVDLTFFLCAASSLPTRKVMSRPRRTGVGESSDSRPLTSGNHFSQAETAARLPRGPGEDPRRHAGLGAAAPLRRDYSPPDK